MLVRFASLTYPDLKITDGKGVLAIFRKGIFETDSPKVIDYLRKCKAECTELKPEPPAKATPPKGDDKPKGDEKPEPPETKKTGE